jgi:ureidoglycolate hydrolase
MTTAATITLSAVRPTSVNFAPFGALLERPSTDATLRRDDITYWHGTGDLGDLDRSGVTGFLTAHRRDALLNILERHNHTCEAFIPISGSSLFVVAAPGPLQLETIRVFLLEPGRGVLLHTGTWHWAPFPLTQSADFLLALRAETPTEDIETLEIPPHRLVFVND